MQCKQCGVGVDPEAVFCQKCGARIGEAGSAALQAGAAARDEYYDDDQPRLAPGRRDEPEVELWQGTVSPRSMIGSVIGLILLAIALLIACFVFNPPTPWWLASMGVVLLLALALAARLLFVRLNVHYRLTNQRLFHKTGILRRVTDRIEVIDMDDVTSEQGIIDRIVGVGTVKITSSDRTHPEIVLEGIERASEVATLIDDSRRNERVRRGLHIEAV